MGEDREIEVTPEISATDEASNRPESAPLTSHACPSGSLKMNGVPVLRAFGPATQLEQAFNGLRADACAKIRFYMI
jgi:hypothetical protein